MSNTSKSLKPKKTTAPAEWVVIVVIIILVVAVILFIYFVLRPQLFSGSDFEGAKRPDATVVCPTTDPPTGLTAAVLDFAVPSFNASWDPVFTTTTIGQSVIGYNMYISTSPNITVGNTTLAGFTPVPQVKATKTGTGSLQFDETYFYRVATVDTCGPGALSAEEFEITIV